MITTIQQLLHNHSNDWRALPDLPGELSARAWVHLREFDQQYHSRDDEMGEHEDSEHSDDQDEGAAGAMLDDFEDEPDPTTRGRHPWTCDLNLDCEKGGVDENGQLRIFEQNSAYRYQGLGMRFCSCRSNFLQKAHGQASEAFQV